MSPSRENNFCYVEITHKKKNIMHGCLRLPRVCVRKYSHAYPILVMSSFGFFFWPSLVTLFTVYARSFLPALSSPTFTSDRDASTDLKNARCLRTCVVTRYNRLFKPALSPLAFNPSVNQNRGLEYAGLYLCLHHGSLLILARRDCNHQAGWLLVLQPTVWLTDNWLLALLGRHPGYFFFPYMQEITKKGIFTLPVSHSHKRLLTKVQGNALIYSSYTGAQQVAGYLRKYTRSRTVKVCNKRGSVRFCTC